MSEPPELPDVETPIAPVLTVGYSDDPGKPNIMGYIIYQDNLNAIAESGRVHELLMCINMMIDHESIRKAVQDQDLLDRLGV